MSLKSVSFKPGMTLSKIVKINKLGVIITENKQSIIHNLIKPKGTKTKKLLDAKQLYKPTTLSHKLLNFHVGENDKKRTATRKIKLKNELETYYRKSSEIIAIENIILYYSFMFLHPIVEHMKTNCCGLHC